MMAPACTRYDNRLSSDWNSVTPGLIRTVSVTAKKRALRISVTVFHAQTNSAFALLRINMSRLFF